MCGITKDQLVAIMPRLKKDVKLGAYLTSLNDSMAEAEINTPLRQAAFLAQLALESGELRYWQEIWGPSKQQLRYEPGTTLAKRLGNTQKGDGYRYRGRGPIQLTGRSNYRVCGLALGLDLEGNPDLVATPEVGFRVACWFWSSRRLNDLADKEDFEGITRKVNGALGHHDRRVVYYERALEALG